MTGPWKLSRRARWERGLSTTIVTIHAGRAIGELSVPTAPADPFVSAVVRSLGLAFAYATPVYLHAFERGPWSFRLHPPREAPRLPACLFIYQPGCSCLLSSLCMPCPFPEQTLEQKVANMLSRARFLSSFSSVNSPLFLPLSIHHQL